MSGKVYRVGSRKSKLAVTQTEHVIHLLKRLLPDCEFEITFTDTIGDKILDVPLSKIGDKGLFTQELEASLMDGSIDFAVHSLKDIPTKFPEGLTIGAITERSNPQDVIIMKKALFEKGFRTLQDLNEDKTTTHCIGTSSLRRKSQILYKYPNLQISDIRGNLDTRLRKLEEGNYSAIVLAYAGLDRLGESYLARISQKLDSNEVFYAVGQGALGVECREGDQEILKLLSHANHKESELKCRCERAMLGKLEGGCHGAIGVITTIEEDVISLSGRVLSKDGTKCLEVKKMGNIENPEKIGEEVADALIQMGAIKLLEE